MSLPDFTDKALSIELKDNATNHDLINPYFEYIGDRLFISGVVPEGATESDWCKGKTLSLAWDEVTFFYVFDSAADLALAIQKSGS